MATRKKKGKKTFQPVDFDAKFGSGEVAPITPQVPEVKKTYAEVVATIKRELELVSIGLSKNCAMAIQFDEKKTPFCRMFSLLQEKPSAKHALELVRLAAQDFGNKFSEFVKDELRHLF